MDGIFYCFDDEWMKDQNVKVVAIRIVAAVVLYFVVVFALIFLLEKLFHTKLTEDE